MSDNVVIKDDDRFKSPRPKAYGEKDIGEVLADFERRLSRLESQAGTA